MNKDMLAESGTRAGQYFERGQTVFERGAAGQPWRVVSGVVWFDDGEGGADSFCGLACPGDVMGAETLIFGHYAMQAHALTPVSVEPWLEAGVPVSARSALAALSGRDQRVASLLALRGGKASERLKRLFDMLASACPNDATAPPRVVLPKLREMACITALQIETVSRTITHLVEEGELQVVERRAQLCYHAATEESFA